MPRIERPPYTRKPFRGRMVGSSNLPRPTTLPCHPPVFTRAGELAESAVSTADLKVAKFRNRSRDSVPQEAGAANKVKKRNTPAATEKDEASSNNRTKRWSIELHELHSVLRTRTRSRRVCSTKWIARVIETFAKTLEYCRGQGKPTIP